MGCQTPSDIVAVIKLILVPHLQEASIMSQQVTTDHKSTWYRIQQLHMCVEVF